MVARVLRASGLVALDGTSESGLLCQPPEDVRSASEIVTLGLASSSGKALKVMSSRASSQLQTSEREIVMSEQH